MINAVIGAGFGDEGKGVITNYICRECKRSVDAVVRFNGGAQAGHTVVTDTANHVFSHFGSGTLLGRKTYLSRFFILNPIIFNIEYSQLINKVAYFPAIMCDSQCMVTTPFDMAANRMKEQHRGALKHGSCGIGINETVERHKHIPLTGADLKSGNYYALVQDILNYHTDRLRSMGIKVSKEDKNKIFSERILDKFAQDVMNFTERVVFVPPSVLGECLVFEGAQGLLLDEDSQFFPHVTRSKTGLKNVVEFSRQLFVRQTIAPTYVTRWYLTRHGAGPLPGEKYGFPYKLTDKTNKENPWQGKIRYALLNVDLLTNTILNDLNTYGRRDMYVSDRFTIVITWADMAPSKIRFIENDNIVEGTMQELKLRIADKFKNTPWQAQIIENHSYKGNMNWGSD